MFTDAEKSSIRDIFRDAGFSHKEQDKYVFSTGKKTNSSTTFFKTIGAPSCFQTKGLLALEVQFLRSKDLGPLWSDFSKEIDAWSDLNKPSQVMANTVDVTQLGLEDIEAEDPTSYIQSLVPTINISKNAKDPVILLDPHRDHRPALEINPEMYMAMVGRDFQTMISDPSILKVFATFDPYNLRSLFVKESKKGSLKTWHVNYYVAPRWRFVDAEPAYEGFIKKLIDHLIPDPYEREYVLDWLHYAIVFRNDTVLCLIGPRGTGKGILLKDILSQLIGEDYREIVNQEILTDKFNGAFKNRRYIFFDEVNVSGERELNKFKAFCNSTIVVEEKGQDSETIDNFTSLGLSSNDKKDFRAEPQERRFSVPEVAAEPLLTVATEQEIEDFVRRIADPESKELAAFGNFLIQRKPKNTSRQPLKGRHFFNLCRLSMPEWKSYIIEYITHEAVPGELILCSNLTKKFKKIHGENAPFATKRGSIETFLGDYFHEGSHRLGRVVDAWDAQRGRDTFAIMPDDNFLLKYGQNKPKLDSDDNALDAL